MRKKQMTEYDKRHGGAYDRGGADAYYRRNFQPHYFKGDTYSSERIELLDPSTEDYKAYVRGYMDALEAGDFKDWG
jgi:hypothetical protein